MTPSRVAHGALLGAALLGLFGACSGSRGGTLAGVDARPPPSSSPPVGVADAAPPLSLEDVCHRAASVRASGLPGKRPFTELEAHCDEKDYFCDTVDRTPDPSATCFVANDNLARAAKEIRATRVGAAGSPLASAPWDGKTPPKYMDRIDAHFHLTREERDLLERNRFVVLDRLAYVDYANAFHDIFQEELPLFVGVDPILHAVFKGTELALERVERTRLRGALTSMLRKLAAGFAASASSMDADTRNDLDVYLGVAAALAEPAKGPKSALRGASAASNASTMHELVSAAAQDSAELQKVSLFGRDRMIDFSQFVPRGHYTRNYATGEPPLDDYFRAMTWLSRLEYNLVSRSARSSDPLLDPRETPREARDALALAELVERTGATPELRVFEDTYAAFAGRREDVPPMKLLELAKAQRIRSSDAESGPKLTNAIGDGWKRTARTHFTVEGAPVLPAIMTLFGARIVPDVAPLTRVVHDEVPDRKWLQASDAGYILGHDRAKRYVADFDQRPGLADAFKRARSELGASADAKNAKDIYGSWLRAVLALGNKPSGVVPSFVTTEAYADHRLNSALVGYGQLRHAFVLLAAQGYDAYGCEIPDAYVEPLPDVFDALLAHVRNMRAQLGGKGWEGLERTLATLAGIARAETTGQPLTEPQRRWLSMVSEYLPVGGFVSTGEPPKWTGWYFDLFEDREHGATKATTFIADYFTLTNAGQVAYLGADGPRLGIFLVDVNGEPRAMVGPVAKGFEVHAPMAGRLDDQKLFESNVTREAPWRASYAAPERPDPPLGLEGELVRCGEPPTKTPAEWRVAVRSTRSLAGPTSITLLDHHGDPLTAPLVLDVDHEWKVGTFDLTPELAAAHFGVEAIHVRVEDLARSRLGAGAFDYTTSASVFWGKDDELTGKLPVRPRGPSYFGIGPPAPRDAR